MPKNGGVMPRMTRKRAPIAPIAVERRDPASYQRTSEHLTWFCWQCRNWTMDGAHLRGRCNWCDCPRSA